MHLCLKCVHWDINVIGKHIFLGIIKLCIHCIMKINYPVLGMKGGGLLGSKHSIIG